MSKKYFKELFLMTDDALNVELENINVSEFRKAINLALKEQDRDTRHACAEAILSCEEDVSGECIWKNEAHNTIMNCREGIC